jgi:pimeloyl-ACP methyl ester carboxylesterase
MSEPGYLDRIIAAHADGVDGWIDDAIATLRPWGFDVSRIEVPVGIWYGQDDVLVPPIHSEWLLEHVSGAERHELPNGHLLQDEDLDAVCVWLFEAGDS